LSERFLRAEQPTAFTLIELVVVMGILTLLIAISYPMLQRWTEAPLRKGARQVTAVIERGYEQAVTSRQLHRLRVDVAGGRYWMEVLMRASDDAVEFVVLPPERALPSGVRFRDLITPQGAVVTEGEAAIYFYPIGRLDRVVVHLAQGEGQQPAEELSLVPHPLTGHVAVAAGYVAFES
jgi:prepilin-type N-terminal cleavage/methylation domain-containing protein